MCVCVCAHMCMGENYNRYRFEFIKGLNGKLVVPNFGTGHEWSGNKVQAIAGQSGIYTRKSYPLYLNKLKVCPTYCA